MEIIEARITHLAYAPEIASAMLQRQQAGAIIAARSQIVEGAVSMVQMALDDLSSRNIVDLDEERKAAMVSNLLVVLCSDKNTQPVVNTDNFQRVLMIRVGLESAVNRGRLIAQIESSTCRLCSQLLNGSLAGRYCLLRTLRLSQPSRGNDSGHRRQDGCVWRHNSPSQKRLRCGADE